MKLTPIDPKEIYDGRDKYVPYRVMNMIADFMASDDECCRLDDIDYKSIYVARSTFDKAIKRMGVDDQVKVFCKNKKMYIVKKRGNEP